MKKQTNKQKIGPITLYQGDALQVMRGLPDNSFTALITDPPYSSGGMHRSDRTKATHAKYIDSSGSAFADFYGDNRDQRSYMQWCALWLAEAWRLLQDGSAICLFTDWRQYPVVSDAIQVAGFIWRGTVVWDKTQGVRPYKGRFRHQAEYILWGSKGMLPKPAKDAPVVPGVLQCSPQRGERLHQVHKPEEVMRQLIRIVPPGGHVLDPFAGSGTTLIEAVRAGHQATGIELSPHYYQVMAERIKGLK